MDCPGCGTKPEDQERWVFNSLLCGKCFDAVWPQLQIQEEIKAVERRGADRMLKLCEVTHPELVNIERLLWNKWEKTQDKG